MQTSIKSYKNTWLSFLNRIILNLPSVTTLSDTNFTDDFLEGGFLKKKHCTYVLQAINPGKAWKRQEKKIKNSLGCVTGLNPSLLNFGQ